MRAAGVEHLVFNTGMALPEDPVGNPMLDGRIVFTQLVADGATALVPTGYLETSRPRGRRHLCSPASCATRCRRTR